MACTSCEARRRALKLEAANVSDFFNRFVAWVKQPYNSDMDVLDWFLFLGLVIVAVFAWRSILNKVLD